MPDQSDFAEKASGPEIIKSRRGILHIVKCRGGVRVSGRRTDTAIIIAQRQMMIGATMDFDFFSFIKKFSFP